MMVMAWLLRGNGVATAWVTPWLLHGNSVLLRGYGVVTHGYGVVPLWLLRKC